jgi:hypothetical protein
MPLRDGQEKSPRSPEAERGLYGEHDPSVNRETVAPTDAAWFWLAARDDRLRIRRPT